MENEDNQNIERDPIEDDFEEDFDDFPESQEWEGIEGDFYGNDSDGFFEPEFDG